MRTNLCLHQVGRAALPRISLHTPALVGAVNVDAAIHLQAQQAGGEMRRHSWHSSELLVIGVAWQLCPYPPAAWLPTCMPLYRSGSWHWAPLSAMMMGEAAALGSLLLGSSAADEGGAWDGSELYIGPPVEAAATSPPSGTHSSHTFSSICRQESQAGRRVSTDLPSWQSKQSVGHASEPDTCARSPSGHTAALQGQHTWQNDMPSTVTQSVASSPLYSAGNWQRCPLMENRVMFAPACAAEGAAWHIAVREEWRGLPTSACSMEAACCTPSPGRCPPELGDRTGSSGPAGVIVLLEVAAPMLRDTSE